MFTSSLSLTSWQSLGRMSGFQARTAVGRVGSCHCSAYRGLGKRRQSVHIPTRGVATYRDTLGNLATTPESRVLVQGFTGKASTFHSKLSIDVGTNIVGGTSPKAGKNLTEHLGKPVFPNIRAAKKELGTIDAVSVFVPPALAAEAVLEAIEEEIPLIVAVAEGIPIRDQARVHAALHSQTKSRYLGANSPGYTNARAGVRMGIAPAAAATAGRIGIAARSGTLSYEATGATSELGLGQTYILGLGGDYYPGTRTDEALEFLLHDKQTEGIILIGEVGGSMEEEVAELLRSLPEPVRQAKPIVGFIAGVNVPPGRAYGHSGAIWRESELAGGSPHEKVRLWKEVGIRIAPSVAETADCIKEELVRRR